MRASKYIKTTLLLMVSTLVFTTSNICVEKVTAQPVKESVVVTSTNTNNTKALSIVANPEKYLNKTVTIDAKFDKFSTLGLDYKPAFKSSDEYISFLIKRDDTIYDIPLSEMKLFLKKEEAEKHIELKTNDEIQIVGTVFSDALGDAWIDVTKLTLTKKAPDKNGVE